MATYTTEIASSTIASDNPIHQRLYYAYVAAKEYVKGDLLEIGCGEGRGVEALAPLANSYTALDKINPVIEELAKKYENIHFISAFVPPMNMLESNKYDVIVTFQVIEHIKNDKFFLEEIYRVLKPGGIALVTTPNIKLTLTRNPWHEREYIDKELKELAEKVFDRVTLKGIHGNKKYMDYYEQNRKSVEKITRFDVFNLQHKLPAPLLRIPYDILNRLNRKSLMKKDNNLVEEITYNDFFLSDETQTCLDFFGIFQKKS
jgi:2-polyprenyl-3-methyl-5-hydroxy-6-metoxy-1,4-benzoquinol methylase